VYDEGDGTTVIKVLKSQTICNDTDWEQYYKNLRDEVVRYLDGTMTLNKLREVLHLMEKELE
jgi:hypothetical protein